MESLKNNLTSHAKGPTATATAAASAGRWPESNPDLTKAMEAAKVVGAKLAVAKFPDTGGKSTDFNDLATLVRTSQNVVPRTLELPECKRARDYCRDMFNDTFPVICRNPRFRTVTPSQCP